MTQPAGVTITLDDIYQLLLDVKGRVDPLPQKVLDLGGDVKALEARVLKLETTKPAGTSSTAQWVGIIVSIVVALTTMLGLIVTLIRVIPGVEV